LTLTKVERIFFDEKLSKIYDDVMAILQAKEHSDQVDYRNKAVHGVEKLLEAIKE